MLLRSLSDKAKANIERTNRGEKPDEAAPVRARERAERSPAPPSGRGGPVDPSKVDVTDSFFTDIVTAQDLIAEEKRHDSGYSHVSSLLRGMCARRTRFQDESGQPEYDWASGPQRIVWKIGRAVEKHIRDSYIKGIKGKGVIGKWACKCERTTMDGEFQKSSACAFCRTAPTEYVEITLFDHEAGICGNPDLLAVMGKDGKLYVIEVKSMNGEEFDELAAAKPDHVFQGAAYRRLLIKNGYENVSEKILVVYATKKYSFRGSPYKPFMVNVDKPEINAVLDGIWENARLIRRSRIDGVIPERTECVSPSSPQAKKCAFVTDCFMRG